MNTLELFKKILHHLESHIEEGNADEEDYKQSKLIRKEIKRRERGAASESVAFKVEPKALTKDSTPQIKANKINKTDNLYKISNPKRAQINAYNYLGPTAILYKSNKPGKKYSILNPYTNKYINFGSDMEDYLYHHDVKRRDNYLKRSAGIKGNWKDNPYSKNNLSRLILWIDQNKQYY